MPKKSEESEATAEEIAAFQQLLAYLVTDECAHTVRTIRYIRERCDPAITPEKLEQRNSSETVTDEWVVGLS